MIGNGGFICASWFLVAGERDLFCVRGIKGEVAVISFSGVGGRGLGLSSAARHGCAGGFPGAASSG